LSRETVVRGVGTKIASVTFFILLTLNEKLFIIQGRLLDEVLDFAWWTFLGGLAEHPKPGISLKVSPASNCKVGRFVCWKRFDIGPREESVSRFGIAPCSR
jgi:hypothetical protein